MTEKERELARKLREARQQIAAHDQIQRATREGCEAAMHAAAEARDEARREVARVRHELLLVMRRAGEISAHNGRVYRRIKAVGDLVTAWESKLPREFVTQARQLTEPDFAELLGVTR